MQQVAQHQIAECRLKIDQCRLLTLFAAHMIDKFGAKASMKQVCFVQLFLKSKTPQFL